MLLTRGRRIICVASHALLVPSALMAQDRGTVLGRVTDATSGTSLTGVQVVVEGTIHGGLSDESGRFLLPGIPAGTYRLRADFIGYAARVNTIEVVAGAMVTWDLRLSPSALALDAVLVTVTGERRRRELGNAVATIETDQVLEVAPVHSMSDLLQGRTSGVQLRAPAAPRAWAAASASAAPRASRCPTSPSSTSTESVWRAPRRSRSGPEVRAPRDSTT